MRSRSISSRGRAARAPRTRHPLWGDAALALLRDALAAGGALGIWCEEPAPGLAKRLARVGLRAETRRVGRGGRRTLSTGCAPGFKFARGVAESPAVAAPSVLILDDGELDRVQALLARIADRLAALRRARRRGGARAPQDLIISSGPRSMRMPELTGSAQPLWVCIYDQDFLPLRERLRDLGVHYLVSGELAPHAFALFLRQLLNRGEERRRVRRIPLQCDVQLVFGRDRAPARLLELSRESCVISANRALEVGQSLSLSLPAEHTGDEELVVSGRVLRATRAPDAVVTAVLGFDDANPRAIAHVQDLLSGNVLGTQVTPLAAEPRVEAATATESWLLGHGFEDQQPELGGAGVERRASPRHAYDRRVEAIRFQGEQEPLAWLGRDLSRTGLCINAWPAPPLRSVVHLALYGRSREEPLLVRAEVVRRDGDEVGLRFVGLGPVEQHALDRLLGSLPTVEDLGAGGDPRHVVEWVAP
jgi:hypothetical protein